VIVSQSDTVVRIWVLKDTVRMHPLLIFVSVVGAVSLMGFVGIFAGPMVAAVLFTLLRILKK
jgi:predicted PurR-regulated permease PerM